MNGHVTACTVLGKRSFQEDRVAIFPTADGYFLVVCDGHNGVETAKEAITLLSILFGAYYTKLSHEEIDAVMKHAVAAVVDATKHNVSGSTLSMVHVSESTRHVHVAVLGDSPVVVRDDRGRIWVSPEHSVEHAFLDCMHVTSCGGFVEKGYISTHPNGPGLAMTRALGDAAFSSILIRDAEYFSFPLGNESFVLVCSDGVYGSRAIQTRADLPPVALLRSAKKIVTAALQDGSRDNISALLWRAQK